jgi:hypothetical protein
MMPVQQHKVVMSNKRYPDRLRIFECRDCDYAFVAKLGQGGVVDPLTRVPINHGDLKAAHSLFAAPRIELEFNVGIEVGDDTCDPS